MQTDILIARTDEALAVFTDYPAQGRWPSLQLKGLDNVKLAALLGALGEGGDARALEGEGCLAAFEKGGPWVFTLPRSLPDSLARLAEPGYIDVASRWVAHEELVHDGWSAADVVPGIAMLKAHAATAVEADQDLMLWMAL